MAVFERADRLIRDGSLRGKFIVGFLAVMLPVLLLLIWQYQQAAELRRTTLSNDYLWKARLAGVLVQSNFDQATGLAWSFASDPNILTFQPSVIDPYLAQLAPVYSSEYESIGVWDDSGLNRGALPAYIYSPAAGSRPSIAATAYFQQVMRMNQPVLSNATIGRITYGPTAVAAVPIRNAVGTPIGVLTVSLRLPSIARRLKAVGIGDGEQIWLVDPTGRLAFSTDHPNLPWAARDVSDFSPVRTALTGNTETFQAAANPFGGESFGAFAPVPRYGWAAGAMISSPQALAPLRPLLVITGAIFIGVVILEIVLISWLVGYLIRPIVRLRRDVLAFGQGNLGRRTAITTGDEIRDLGDAFNQMANQLQHRQSEVMALLGREQALAQIAQQLVQQVNLEGVVKVVTDELVRVLKVDALALWLADPSRRELTLLREYNHSSEAVEAIRQISYDAPFIAAKAARTDQIQAIEDTSSLRMPEPAREFYQRTGMHSLISIPLHARGRLVGVLSYGTRAPRAFTPQDLDFNATIGGLFAVAIENAQLFDEVHLALRLREEFMRAAAHELRTPVTVIMGRSQLTLRNDAQEPRARKTLETVVRQAERISHLIDDLTTAIRVQPGQVVLNREVFDLSVLARERVARVAQVTPERTFAVEAPQPVCVNADRELIGEAINDLLGNAVRYARAGTPIEVRVSRAGHLATLSVTDHGPGIPPERQAHVFEPFYEPYPPGASAYAGVVSLGLYLSRQIIRSHHGQIWLESSPGRTTFTFTLPLSEVPHGADVGVGREGSGAKEPRSAPRGAA